MDLILHADKIYLYWPPFPAIVVAPLVALFGAGVSDVVYTALLAALGIGLLAKLLAILDAREIAPLSRERRALMVVTIAFGSVMLILAPVGRVWFTAQIIGWDCVLLATLAALTLHGARGYFFVGLALACALATRNGLIFNGVWLAYFMLHRDQHQPLRRQLGALLSGALPVLTTIALLAGYNWARFGNPLEMGLAWHNMDPNLRADFQRYGVFNLHYLPTNLYYQFVAFTTLTHKQWSGGGLFWMTPVLIGALFALVNEWRSKLVQALALSCLLSYLPIGLVMGTGYITFGPRYLLDLMVPVVVLTAIGIRKWNLALLQGLMLISCLTYLGGSIMWALYVFP